MKLSSFARLGAVVAAATLALAGCASSGSADPATESESVTITDAWVKAVDSGMSAGFGEIENTGSADVAIVAVETEASSMSELHETVEDGAGSMQMQEVTSFVVPAGGSLTLEPGGNHFMLMDVAQPLVAGEEVTFTLTFEDGSTLVYTAPVKDFSGANEDYVGDDMDGDMDHDHDHGDDEDHDHDH